MLSRRFKSSLRWGALIGGAHLFAISAVAAVAAISSSGEAWYYAALIDWPLQWLLIIPSLTFLRGMEHWPALRFLPGMLGQWDAFLFPALYYGLFGTACWFTLGWAFGNLLDRKRTSVDHARI
jgi:hypothetical protein